MRWQWVLAGPKHNAGETRTCYKRNNSPGAVAEGPEFLSFCSVGIRQTGLLGRSPQSTEPLVFLVATISKL